MKFLLMLTFALSLAAEGWVPRPPLGLDIYMPTPITNSLTREKVALGRRLFFDKRLSRATSARSGPRFTVRSVRRRARRFAECPRENRLAVVPRQRRLQRLPYRSEFHRRAIPQHRRRLA